MDTVRIYHPRLPGQHSDVPESAVPHWSRSGWTVEKPDWAIQQEQEEAAKQAEKEQAEASEKSGASPLERSPRRRRHTEE
ncbi:MAG: hypothetical protein ACRDT2_01990 [Natronosporangium sp.]